MGIAPKKIANTVIEILVNFVLPYVIYVKAEAGLGQVHALLASSLPPILWSLIEFARNRRVDALSLLVLAGILLSLLAFLGGGSVRFLQLREKLVTGLIGLIFLGSAAIGRPLIYQLAVAGKRRESEADAQEFEKLRDKPIVKHGMMVMTLVWGFGFVIEAALASVLVFLIPIRSFLLVAPVMGYGAIGCMTLWTFWYAGRMKKRGKAARLAAEAKIGSVAEN
jgi:hypothetical protein